MNEVLFADNKAFIGAEHGKPINLPEGDKKKVKSLAGKHGVWYEGAGGDIEPNKALFSREDYEGSWDEAMTESVKGYPPEFLSTLFTNVAANKQKQHLANPSQTIFASIMNAQDKVGYLKDRKFSEATLRKFLKACSSVGLDFVTMSQKKATPANVGYFLDAGERLMWPKDWEKYPNAAGKVMRKLEEARIKFLKNAPAGVYVVGKDHLPLLAR
jgi:hypothetical protein